jgi:hypothetical protein
MISRCTWVLLAAVAFVFINSYLSWPPKLAPGSVGWDYSQLPPQPHEQWLMIGILCAVALSVSFLIDLIRKRRSEI